MPVLIDSPHQTESQRRRRRLLILGAIFLALLAASRTLLSYWVDLLWFNSLGYGQVFWKSTGLQIASFVIFAVVTFAVLFVALSTLRRLHRSALPSDHKLMIGGQPVNLSVEPALRIISLLLSLVVAVITGGSMATDWPTLALFWYAPHATGPVVDPIFSRPLNFFLFTLPAWQLLLGWLLTLSIITCIASVVFLLITSGARALDKTRTLNTPSPWRGALSHGSRTTHCAHYRPGRCHVEFG